MSVEHMNPFVARETEQTRKQVPESEFEIQFARSSGPGGQNVNKTSTKAQVRWNLEASQSFSEEEKDVLRERLASRLTKRGELVIASMKERSQLLNKERAIARLQSLVAEALIPETKRVPTKPSRSAKRKRLEQKSKRADIKKSRRWQSEE
ncbi:aminoacyl-tRNA hydrolase [Candidatus Uhrbacteria bacterium CG22_combo_CG10-13_8_21_14_all_47_17]|uniref:Aminoacyl-tRNA hydrolase n=1 Tax=Candidatus Uhrbacteria bacterium CG22_combo_CG10-13_8_21_14_all_47_17 TaxID=1975041 RepID=A0A2H0BR32_9BACT|nr:MAG: aminoacyl-tRNA hydrolase [Candidatus Uhrbacteria bacterium CG22_combo_CG10-13_8_21_14_all_47_17]